MGSDWFGNSSVFDRISGAKIVIDDGGNFERGGNDGVVSLGLVAEPVKIAAQISTHSMAQISYAGSIYLFRDFCWGDAAGLTIDIY